MALLGMQVRFISEAKNNRFLISSLEKEMTLYFSNMNTTLSPIIVNILLTLGKRKVCHFFKWYDFLRYYCWSLTFGYIKIKGTIEIRLERRRICIISREEVSSKERTTIFKRKIENKEIERLPSKLLWKI